MTSSRTRRRFLGALTAAGGGAAAGLPERAAAQAAAAEGIEAAVLPWFTRAQAHRSLRQSSYDRIGGNADTRAIEPGATLTVYEQEGPAVVTHVWFTAAAESPHYLKELVLRGFWDGETDPSIEAPLGDFFGLNLGEHFVYQSAFLDCSPARALNCYLPMPHRRHGRLTVTNEGARGVGAFYSNVDFQLVSALPDDVLYLHAWYNQAAPNQIARADDAGPLTNASGRGNYLYAEAHGRGHLFGVTLGIRQHEDRWPGEGDEMIFVDDGASPLIVGTGTEDYFGGAWNFGGVSAATPFAHLYHGAPHISGPERAGGSYVCYRWHADNPVTFTRSMMHTMEHGHANERADSYYSCCYWYQTEPHLRFPPLAEAARRIPPAPRTGAAS